MKEFWIDYYKSEFLPTYNNYKHSCVDKKEINPTELCSQYAKLVMDSCELLRRYLAHMGLFQYDKWEIIREAFYDELITNGDTWINAISLVEAFQKVGYLPVAKLIKDYSKKEHFSIFNDLAEIFRNIAENNDD